MKMTWLSGPRKWGAASAALLAGLLFTWSGTASAQSGIAATRHNLGSAANGIANRNQVSNTAEICVFCHTPHGANTNVQAPLWNKRVGNGTNTTDGSTAYTTYAAMNSASLDGTIATVGSVSLACLSCHDGTQAMDNIINAPGSGLYDPTGGSATAGAGRGWNWTGDAQNAGKLINANGRIANLGGDLSNDHPIGIQYCGGGIAANGTGTCKDGDFVAVTTGTVNSQTVFWVDTGLAGTRQRTDLPLYVRSGGDASLGPMVECGSCHDPHVSSGQAGPAGTNRTAGETFLRISNAESAVCRACHNK